MHNNTSPMEPDSPFWTIPVSSSQKLILAAFSYQLRNGISVLTGARVAKLTGFSRQSASDNCGQLVRQGWLTNYGKSLSPEHIKNKILSSKSPQKFAGGDVCDWCQCTTLALQSHHYPVSKSEGGIDVVDICPNCHYEFHFLEQAHGFSLSDKFHSLAGSEA